jgi:hypothetical protein
MGNLIEILFVCPIPPPGADQPIMAAISRRGVPKKRRKAKLTINYPKYMSDELNG